MWPCDVRREFHFNFRETRIKTAREHVHTRTRTCISCSNPRKKKKKKKNLRGWLVSRRVCYTILGWKFLSVAKIFLAERALYREASFFEMPHVYGGGNVQIDRRSERERVSSLFSGSGDKLCPFNQGGGEGGGGDKLDLVYVENKETRTIIREISSVINLIFRFFFLFEQFLFEKYRAR